ncbi:unnamed protein product [Rotaria sp. Silwood1]|nr:unnamed protein product [Rotaria sp. Silwood1]CAF4711454.1 unnamed protein product [Rotaria sp. Silwood1]
MFKVYAHDNDCGGSNPSDEAVDCVPRPCVNEYFECSTSHCISNTSRCDGYAQWQDSSNKADCPSGSEG